MRNLISLFTLFFIFNISLQAIDIKGRIIDTKNKKPVESVTTVLMKTDSTHITGCHTDMSGVFSIGGQFQKQDYLLKASFLGYRTTYIKISNLSSNIDLGDIELEEDSQSLNEVTVTGNRIINKVDRQIILPDSMQIKSSVNAFDLLKNLSLARINIDPVNQIIKMGRDDVQLRINGVRATPQEVSTLRSQDILRVEYFEDAGVRFGNENVAAVINLIVDRQKNYGGYVAIDARNAPTVGFGNDNLTFKTNYKASEFALNYFVNYRSYDNRWSNTEETLNFTDNPIRREQKGIKEPMEYQYHNVNLTYNLTVPDKYVFNVILKNQIYNYDRTNASNNFYSDKIGQTYSKSNNNGSDYTPALDLYYRHELKNKQSIALNVVGTYIDSDSENKYLEKENNTAISDIHNKVDGKKYSIISEAIYEKQFQNLTLSAGGKHTQGLADNVYTGDTDIKTDMKNAESYLFAQIQGKIAKKIGYTLGLGGTRIWYKEGANDATYYFLRPAVQLSYSPNDYFSIKYAFNVNTRTPSLGQLSNVEQQTDSYQINRGNPNLKPYKTYNNRLTFGYNKGMLDLSTTFGYMYFHKLIISTYSIENDKIISFADNQKGQNYLYWSVNATAKIIKDIWTLNGWFGLQRDMFEAESGIKHNYNGLYGGISTNVFYKNILFDCGMNLRPRDLWGENINYGEDWSYVEAGYKYKEARLSLGMSYPFKNYWSAGNRNLSSVKPSKSWHYIKENGHMLYLRFSWNMSFGRKHEAGQKKLNNADSDKGIL